MRPFHINSAGEVDLGGRYAGHVDDLMTGFMLNADERYIASRWQRVMSMIPTSLYRAYAWRNLSAQDIPSEGVFFEAEYELGEDVALFERKRWIPKGEHSDLIGKQHVQRLVNRLVNRLARSGYDVFVETDTSVGFRWSVFVKVEGAEDALKVMEIMERFRWTTDLRKHIVSVM